MYKRILVPVDGSELSDRAIQASVDLAAQLRATVVAFVAEPLAPIPSTPRVQAVLQQEQLEHDALTAAHAKPVLTRFEAAARAAGVPFEGYFDQVPNADKAIITAAESHDCDMIVMVTHGRGAFGEFLFGSHTKAVLAGSQLPLLVLH
jgi:nucleotide-binding universal stress UspA family protein